MGVSNPANHFINDGPGNEQSTDRRFLVVAFSFLGVVIVGILSFIFYQALIRDTYVRDNYAAILQDLQAADDSMQRKDIVAGIEKYRQVCMSIGEHRVDDPALLDRIRKAQDEVRKYDDAVMAAKTAAEGAAVAAEVRRAEAIRAQKEAALIDPNNISDPLTVKVFVSAKQDYEKYGWSTDLLNATIKSQILFERDPSNSNLIATDGLLARFEAEWHANRSSVGLPPEKPTDER